MGMELKHTPDGRPYYVSDQVHTTRVDQEERLAKLQSLLVQVDAASVRATREKALDNFTEADRAKLARLAGIAAKVRPEVAELKAALGKSDNVDDIEALMAELGIE